MTNTLHAHVSSTSTDCDGMYSREYVMVQEDGQDEFDFQTRVMDNLVSTTGFGGTLKVHNDEDGLRMEWMETTEEGSRHLDADFCTKDCETDMSLTRDHSAEAMNY